MNAVNALPKASNSPSDKKLPTALQIRHGTKMIVVVIIDKANTYDDNRVGLILV